MADGQSTISSTVAPGSTTLPPAVDALARDKKVSPAEERDALSYFLTATPPGRHYVDVEMDFEGRGMATLRFHILAMRGKRIEAIENANKKGEGPFAQIDQLQADAELVTEGTDFVEDPESGRGVKLDSPAFMGPAASPVIALQARFEGQEGLLGHIANRIRSISGWSPDRVGEAKRIVGSNAVGKP